MGQFNLYSSYFKKPCFVFRYLSGSWSVRASGAWQGLNTAFLVKSTDSLKHVFAHGLCGSTVDLSNNMFLHILVIAFKDYLVFL